MGPQHTHTCTWASDSHNHCSGFGYACSCHCLLPCLNILSPCLSLGIGLLWGRFGTWQSFFIRCNLPTGLLHIGVVTTFMQLTQCAPLLPLPLCRRCGVLPLITLRPCCHNRGEINMAT